MKKISAALLVVAFALTSCGGKDKKTPEQEAKTKTEYEKTKADLGETETKNPEMFLTATAHDKKNIIGQTVIRGSVTNNAKVSTFHDVDLEVTYFSKTGTLLEKDKEVVYETLGPGDSKSFKIKNLAPKGTDSVSLKV